MAEQLKNLVEINEKAEEKALGSKTPETTPIEELKPNNKKIAEQTAADILKSEQEIKNAQIEINQRIENGKNVEAREMPLSPEAEQMIKNNLFNNVTEISDTKKSFEKMSDAEMYNQAQILTIEKMAAYLLPIKNAMKEGSDDRKGINTILANIANNIEAIRQKSAKGQALFSFSKMMEEKFNKAGLDQIASKKIKDVLKDGGYKQGGFFSGTNYESFQKPLLQEILGENRAESFTKMAKIADSRQKDSGGKSMLGQDVYFSSKTTENLVEQAK
jgi:hypothetical protein